MMRCRLFIQSFHLGSGKPQIRKRVEADPESYFLLKVVLVKLKVTLGGKCFASAA